MKKGGSSLTPDVVGAIVERYDSVVFGAYADRGTEPFDGKAGGLAD